MLTKAFEVVQNQPTGEQFRRLILDAPDVVAILEADLTVRFVSRSVQGALGFSPEEVEGCNLREYLNPGEVERVFFEFRRPPGEGGAGAPRSSEVGLRHKDGSWRCFDASVVDRLDDSGFRGIVVYLRDMTERKAQEEQLAHRAMHDQLTGLPNRALFLDRLSRALGAAAREFEPVAVLYLDLDDFKAINDSQGHAVGDQVLVALGQRVRACLRPGDTVARLGGDEFAVLIEEAARDAERVAARIREALREPLDLGGSGVRVSASVGVAMSSGVPGDRPEDLLRAADAAMYRAKKARGYSSNALDAARGGARPGLEDRLRRAMESDELSLHYQAVSRPDTRRIVCMEALLRCETPELGALPPQEIVDLAEQSELLDPLGRWILREACRQAVVWRRMWADRPPLVSVNLSARQVRQASLPETIGATLRETGLDAGGLLLEIAEESLTDGDADGVVRRLRRLKALGVKIAVDGFAPGNPEFPDFAPLPIDYLKFEGSLVRNLGRGRKNAGLLVSLYTGLAQARDIGVIAEGVESVEQLRALEQMDCDLVQGFYLWRPLPGPRATELLMANLGSFRGECETDGRGERVREEFLG